MTNHLPVFERLEHEILAGAEHVSDWFHRDQHATQTPATQPATMKPATQQEDTMSLATFEADFGSRVAAFEAAVHNEIGKIVADVPAITADVRSLAASPLGQLAVQAAEHLAAGVIPPEALAIVESGAADLYGKILGLYNPQGAQQAPAAIADPSQPPAQ